MKPLQLPPTIRTPGLDEVPRSPEIIQRIEERASANIVQGYTIQPNPSDAFPYRFYAEVNIDNDNLWQLVKALAIQLPDEVSFIYGDYEHPSFSKYMDKYKLFNFIEPYKTELTQDGFLEFGIIYQDKIYMEEIFVKGAKFIQYWGMDEQRFRKTLKDFQIDQVPGMKFIDEYPLVTEALRMHRQDVIEPSELMDRFDQIFAAEGR
jgi:hypothetical protein